MIHLDINDLAIIGLSVNVIGAVLLTISSRMVSKSIATIIQHISEDYGTFDSEKLPEDQVTDLNNSIQRNKKISIVGWILFISGFCIRIVSLV